MNISNFRHQIQPMPELVRKALVKEKLMADYQARPAYQQNDYLLWISSAKRQETKKNACTRC